MVEAEAGALDGALRFLAIVTAAPCGAVRRAAAAAAIVGAGEVADAGDDTLRGWLVLGAGRRSWDALMEVGQGSMGGLVRQSDAEPGKLMARGLPEAARREGRRYVCA
jgi:hypothetical protein